MFPLSKAIKITPCRRMAIFHTKDIEDFLSEVDVDYKWFVLDNIPFDINRNIIFNDLKFTTEFVDSAETIFEMMDIDLHDVEYWLPDESHPMFLMDDDITIAIAPIVKPLVRVINLRTEDY